jgi:hypothetical protein
MKFMTPAALAAVWLAQVSPVRADTLRCGSRLVEEGMRLTEVLERCGEPTWNTTFIEPIRARSLNGTVYEVSGSLKDVLRYDRGPGKFPANLIFIDGILESIEFEKSP